MAFSVKGTLKTLVTNPIRSFTTGIKGIVKGGFQQTPKNVTSFVVPGTFPSAGIGKGVKSAATGLKNIFKRATVNPFAGTTIKEGFKKIGTTTLGGAVAGGSFGVAYGASKALATNQAPNVKTILKSIGYGASAAISLPGAIAGEIGGLGSNAIDKYQNLKSTMQNPTVPLFNEQPLKDILEKMPTFETPPFMPELSLSQAPINISTSTPQLQPSSGGGFSFSPSVSSGGMGEILPLLLLLGAGGAAAGYIIGKKRKKKKYKKRRRRK